MTTTYFIDGTTPIVSSWLNDVNATVYTTVPGIIGANGATNVGYTPAGTGAVATTVSAKLRETVSVKDFGAVGNGVADDTAAIQRAITYSNSIGGVAIRFPAGTYYYTNFVVDSSDTAIVGEGWGITILKPQGWIDGIRFANGYPGANPVVSNSGVTNLTVDCTDQTAGANDTYGNGLNFNNCNAFFCRNVQVLKHKQQGIVSTYFASGYPNQSVGYIVENEVDASQSQNIIIGVEAQPQGLVISNNRVINVGNTNTVGIYVGNATGTAAGGDINITNNIITGTVGAVGVGIKVENTQNRVLISNNNIYGLGTGIRMQRNTAGALVNNYLVTSNVVQNFTTYGIIAYPIPVGEDSKTIISDNHVYSDNADTAGYAIYVASKVFVTGNRIAANSKHGVYVVGASSVVSNNYIVNSYSYSIEANTSTSCVITNNYVGTNIEIASDTIMFGNIGNSVPNWNTQYVGVAKIKRNPNGNLAPVSGDWNQGDQVYNTLPTSTGYLGWVCTVTGTPGTWKTFGLIS